MEYPLYLWETRLPPCIIFMLILLLLGCGKQSEKTGSTVPPTDSVRVAPDYPHTLFPAGHTTASTPDTISLISSDVPPAGDHSLFWIGVARIDGVIFPFALYDHGKWTNPWPNDGILEPVSPGDVTVTTLDGIPGKWFSPLPKVPREWYVLQTGGYAGKVRVERPAAVYEYCFRRWALAHRFSPDLEDKRKHNPTTKIGIAANEVQTALTAEKLDVNSEIGQKVFSFIAPEFDKAEENAGIPVPDAERAETRLIPLSLFRCENSKGGHTIHFEVRKDYNRKISDDLLTNEGSSFFTVWVNEDDRGDLRILKKQMSLRGWHPKTFEKPMGILSVAGKIFWFIQLIGYEGEAYQVYEVSSEEIKLILNVYGGGC